jgi:hypothetical protein
MSKRGVSVKIYCIDHHTNHHLSDGDAEKLIQALLAAYYDEMERPDGDRVHAGESMGLYDACPLQELSWMQDAEAYAEHIESMIECRRDCARRAAAGDGA